MPRHLHKEVMKVPAEMEFLGVMEDGIFKKKIVYYIPRNAHLSLLTIGVLGTKCHLDYSREMGYAGFFSALIGVLAEMVSSPVKSHLKTRLLSLFLTILY